MMKMALAMPMPTALEGVVSGDGGGEWGDGQVTAAEDDDEVDSDTALELETPDEWDGEGGEEDVGCDVASWERSATRY